MSDKYAEFIDQQEVTESFDVDGGNIIVAIAFCEDGKGDMELHIRELEMMSIEQRKNAVFHLMAATDVIINSIKEDETSTVN